MQTMMDIPEQAGNEHDLSKPRRESEINVDVALSKIQADAMKSMICQLIEMRYFCASLEMRYLGHLIGMVTLEMERLAKQHVDGLQSD